MASKIKEFYSGPDCVICAGSGLNDKAERWKFCLCDAGEKLRAVDPEAADRAQGVSIG